jgi:hypothetical protein
MKHAMHLTCSAPDSRQLQCGCARVCVFIRRHRHTAIFALTIFAVKPARAGGMYNPEGNGSDFLGSLLLHFPPVLGDPVASTGSFIFIIQCIFL